MKPRNSKPIKITEFESLYARGTSGTSYNPDDATPYNGFTKNDDIRYFPWGINSRPGYVNSSVIGGITNIVQKFDYTTNNPVNNNIITGYILVSNTGGDLKIYDSNAAVPATAIFTALGFGSSYVNILVLFGRIYFTIHDYLTAVSIGSVLQIYTPGDAASRDLAGTGPGLAGVNFASSGTAGVVSQGLHVFGVAYETKSGHITALSDNTGTDVGFYTLANANQQVTATGLPSPLPANISKTWIVASRLIPNSSGNASDYEIFFVASDAGTGTVTFDFSDESLQDSADYLYDLFGQVPMQLGMTFYANRMILWGERYITGFPFTVGPSSPRVSESGKPESFSTSHGFFDVFNDDGSGGVRCCFEYKGLLIIQKANKTFVTRDNGDEPNTWQVDILDGVIGSILFGAVKSLGSVGNIKSDYTISIATSGVYLFDGKYSDIPLTWKIERLWQVFAEDSEYDKYQILDIPNAKLFLVLVHATAESKPYKLLVCDYSRGLTYDSVRWSVWNLTNQVYWMSLATTTDVYFVRSNGSTVFKMVLGTSASESVTDNGSVINGQIITAQLEGFSDELEYLTYVQARMQGTFSGVDAGDLEYINDVGASSALPDIPSALNGSEDITQVQINKSGFQGRLSWIFSTNGTTRFFRMKKLFVYGHVSSQNLLNP